MHSLLQHALCQSRHTTSTTGFTKTIARGQLQHMTIGELSLGQSASRPSRSPLPAPIGWGNTLVILSVGMTAVLEPAAAYHGILGAGCPPNFWATIQVRARPRIHLATLK